MDSIKRVAVLLYGQPRYIDNPYSYSSQLKHIFNKYKVDVFSHMWWSESENMYDYSKFTLDKKQKTYHPYLSTVTSDPEVPMKINKNFSPIKAVFEPSQCFINKLLYDKISQVFKNTKLYTLANLSNFLSQAKSIESVGLLYEEYLSDGGDPHDLFILLRTDLIIYELPNLNQLKNNRFYISDHHNDFPDLIFIFGKKFINFCKIYSYMMSPKCIKDLRKAKNAYAEQFKYLTYRNYFSRFFIRKVYMPSYAVRATDDEG